MNRDFVQGEPKHTTVILKQRRVGLRIFSVIALVLLVAITVIVASSENFRWHIVGKFLFDPNILVGVGNTLILTFLSMLVGTLIGVVLALMKLSGLRELEWIADGYIWFFRGVPLLVQLLFWFNLAALFPQIGIPGVLELNANEVISPFMAAFLALALHEGAYMAEIVRSGILSIDRGQSEAAGALGFTPQKIMASVVLPQAMRVIIPPTGNQVISMLKTTSLVSVIAINDLLYSSQIIYSANYQVIPLLLVACVWYLLLVTVLTLIQSRIERHFSRSSLVAVGR